MGLLGVKAVKKSRPQQSVVGLGFSLLLTIFAHGQEGLPEVPRPLPTEKAAILSQADSLAKNVIAPPLPAGSPKLAALRARVTNLQQKQMSYLQDLSAGKTMPFPEIHEQWPAHQITVKNLQTSLQALSEEKDPQKRAELSKAFFAALQPIGFLLQDADYVESFSGLLTPAQATELKALEKEWDALVPTFQSEQEMEKMSFGAIGLQEAHTLLNLSVPLRVQAKPKSLVLFRAHDGGQFENGLSIYKTVADEAGIAEAHWVSHGDAISISHIDYRSPGLFKEGDAFRVRTVRLALKAPVAFHFPELPKTPVPAP